MSYTIAIAGKGGTGKTTTCSLLVRLIKERGLGSILVVDADPNSNVGELLGIAVKTTVGQLLDSVAKDPSKIPAGMPKERFLEYQLQTAVEEADGFDLLTMGRPEGPGCYCYVNNVLRNVVAKLMKEYDYVIIDNEAGLEHLSRRTTRAADVLLVVSDATVIGLKAAQRILELTQELEIKIQRRCLLINRYDKDLEKTQIVNDKDVAYIGFVPFDPQIERLSLNGTCLWDLPTTSISMISLNACIERLIHS